MTSIALLQDDGEHPVPEFLRPIFAEIASAFAADDFSLQRHPIVGVDPISPETASSIQVQVRAYGDDFAALDPKTWERSCYGWAGSHWQALVDLSTTNEPVSDLTLHADIHLEPELRITVRSGHVP